MNKLKIAFSLAAVLLSNTTQAGPMVELFTSQGCYSCPPADELLGELLEQDPDLVALEFHVDYWDDLRYGSAGVWKDPFSMAEYTSRQVAYNSVDLRGRKGVYTPQMIINGSTAQVGSSRGPVVDSLQNNLPDIDINASIQNNQLAVGIDGEDSGGTTLWLAVFDRLQETEVERGENHGKTMINHHVVRELVSLGEWNAQTHGENVTQTFQLPANVGLTDVTAEQINNGNRSCAVFLQDDRLGQIRGATYCEAI